MFVRRGFRRLQCYFLLLGVLGAGIRANPVDVGSRKQLFFDDHVIESMQGVYRIMNQPLKYAGNPVIRMDRCWEADMHFGNSPNLAFDPDRNVYQMWHQVVNYDWSDNFVGYYESRDGLNWDKPMVGQFDYHSKWCPGEASRKHNFVFGKDVGARAPGVARDPHESDPRKRYKMLYRHNSKDPKVNGVWAAHSPDGIQWELYDGVNPVFLNNDTHQVFFWDPRRNLYVAHIRLWPPIFKDHPLFRGTRREGRVRTPGIATSPDFLTWDAPAEMKDPVEVNRKYILVPPDEKDAPCTGGFYTFETLLYEGIYIGFLTPYHICPGMEPMTPPSRDLARNPWLDRIDIQLAYSRDGTNWQRVGQRRPFIPNGPEGSYDSGMIFVAQPPLVREDRGEIWLYYTGFKKGHWGVRRGENQESSQNLAVLRLDGFLSLAAGRGSFTTKPLRFSGNRLRLNGSTAGDEGAIQVEILDPETGEPLPGYSREDCQSFRGDSIAHTVSWKKKFDLTALKGRVLQLRFHMQRSKIFSFQFFSEWLMADPPQ